MKQTVLVLALCTSMSVAFAQPNRISLSLITQTQNSEHTTPASILENAVQSIGGRRELEAIKSLQLHGIIRLPNNRPVVEIELATSQGGNVLGVMSFVGLGQTRFGSDGTTAWEQSFEPNQPPTYTIIDQSTLSQKVQQINWLEWFTTLPDHLEQMKYEGVVEFDGETCLQLRIQINALRSELAFFSKETHRPKGRRTVEPTPNGDAIVEVYFRDWRHVNKLLLFHTVIYNRDGKKVTMTLDQIEVDNIDDALFALPDPVKNLRDKP